MNSERQRWLSWLLVTLIVTVIIGGFAFYRPFNSGAPAAAPLEPLPPKPELNTLPEGRQTFLVMGVDNTDGEFGRADSMVVVSYDAKAQRLALLSIPRDTWTQIPGHGYDKINHAFAYGGQALAVDTVERLLGIDINHWVTLSFDGFIKVVDAVGGVEINPEKPLFYQDPYDERMGTEGLVIDIKPGRQVVDGLTALKYSRFRADAEGDIGRMRRQQEVIQALIKKAATPAILSKVPSLIPALYSAVGTDMSVAEMLKLAAVGREALSQPLVTGSIKGEGMTLDGVFYFGVDLVETRTTAYEVLVGSQPDEPFLNRARQDKAAYDAALREATVASAGAPHEAERNTGTQAGEEADEHPGEQPGEGQSTTPTKPPATPGPTTPKPTAPKTEAITVAVVDATGQGIARDYVQKLRAAGFRVARISRSQKVLPSTLVIDHANLPLVQERLKALFPDLIYAAAPDPRAELPVEIILGTDLLQKKAP